MRSKTSTLEELIPSWMWRWSLTPQKIQEYFDVKLNKITPMAYSFDYIWRGNQQGSSIIVVPDQGKVTWKEFYPNHITDFRHTGLGTYAHIETLVELVNHDEYLLNRLLTHSFVSDKRQIQLERV